MQQSQQMQNANQHSTEITLKEIILKAREWWLVLWQKKMLISSLVIIGGLIGFCASRFSKSSYIGEVTFVLEDNSSSPLGAYLGLASQMGLDLGGKSGSGVFQGDNIMLFLKSRLMIEKTLLSPVTDFTVDSTQSLAEVFIEFNGLREKWKDKPALTNIRFKPGADRKRFTLQQDSILDDINQKIVKQYLNVDKTDKKLSFISVQCISPNEIFSKAFAEKLVRDATNFYIETKTKSTKANVDRLQRQADSLEIQLNKSTYITAATQDLNMNPAKQIAGVKVELAQRNKLVLQTMYGEIVKNLEMSKIAMAQETPIIQVIDTPILPLHKKKLGAIKGSFIGGFVFGLIAVVALLLRKILKDIMV